MRRVAIPARLIQWKQRLLDLGKRNRLVYFKPTKRTTLQLTHPDVERIFDRLVHQELPLQFYLPPDTQLDAEDEADEPGAAFAEALPEVGPNELLTDKPPQQLLLSLNQLRQRARTAVEEQGVNVLYVAFGFLEWTESASSQNLIRSPLILVPVALHQKSLLDPYQLVPYDDDVVLNPTLVYKLDKEFGFTLPSLPDDTDNLSLGAYLADVEDRVRPKLWRVIRDAQLSLFSFLKLKMYRDLEENAGAIADHPIIAALTGDTSRLAPLPADLPEPEELDARVSPHDTFQVVDADSSQQRAILMAKRGVSFVLQGPPGTGKSQTITNIMSWTLRREAEKRRRQKPLRKLFAEIPELLLTLKPCLLMSPLSVSQFLAAGLFRFDVVIFDEASQVLPEDAVGAIFRGDQLIVVGDREQLPPTSFFAAGISDAAWDGDGEEDEADAFDSILEECAAVLDRSDLRWHYRSRHEHLIAFSNAEIYRNLVTFPGASQEGADQGLEFIYVPDGVYDRSGSRTNRVEAKRVADLVFEHVRRHPKRSLGVVTFSQAQQDAVEAQLRQMRLANPEMEPFFREDGEEPFFIKNLENVQGDERDTIILSVGYGKDPSGVLHMNFGPLNSTNGYRRLNVAITRAKYNLKLVSSIRPQDIDPNRTSARGVHMLRSYLDFALHGPAVLQDKLPAGKAGGFDSPFEEAVYRELVRNGYAVDTQVGCSAHGRITL